MKIVKKLLDDTSRTFTMVTTYAALGWRAGSAEVMAAQTEHLEARRRPNVLAGVIP